MFQIKFIFKRLANFMILIYYNIYFSSDAVAKYTW